MASCHLRFASCFLRRERERHMGWSGAAVLRRWQELTGHAPAALCVVERKFQDLRRLPPLILDHMSSQLGDESSRVVVWMTPLIGVSHYEIRTEVAEQPGKRFDQRGHLKARILIGGAQPQNPASRDVHQR